MWSTSFLPMWTMWALALLMEMSPHKDRENSDQGGNWTHDLRVRSTLLSDWATRSGGSRSWELSGFNSHPGARVSKVAKTFRARKAICEIANRLFWKADLLIFFQGNKKKVNCEIWRIKCFPFLSYKGNCDTRKWPVKFRDVREMAPWSDFCCPCVGPWFILVEN